jgi:serine/threonine-protein kinase
MIADEPTDPDDELAHALAAYDDVLAAGIPAQVTPEQPTPSAVGPRFERNLACLHLLRRHWPGRKPQADPAESLGPPVTLGHFEVRRELGRGGYGIVFLARDLRLHRDVALKIPRADLLISPELRIRFQQEARAAAGLEHPNIVSVYEAGEIGQVYYIASAYCPGVALSDWLKAQSEPVPARLAAALIAALADGVQHAHSRGVLHRDLKPANILLVSSESSRGRDDQSGIRPAEPPEPNNTPLSTRHSTTRHPTTHDSPLTTYHPKITDFGLAKLLQEEGAGTAMGGVTHSGTIVGTPNYMSPEQARAQTKQVTTATDIYALGVILYEMLTGRPPFQGETPLETLRQIDLAEAIPPGRLRAKLPRDLETICLKCLRKAPHERYASAAALADDLRRFLADEPIRARPIGAGEWLLKWARRRPERAALIGVIGVAAVGLVVGGIWYSAKLSKALQVAEQQREESNRNFALARQAVEDYLAKVTENKRLTEADLHSLRRDLLQAALPFYEKFVEQTENDPALRAEQGRAYERLGKVRNLLGESDKALANFRQMQAIFEELTQLHPDAGDYRQNLGQAHNDIGDALENLGRSEEAEQEHARALAVQQALADRYPGIVEYRRDAGFSHFARARLLSILGRRTESIAEYRQSLETHERLVRDFPSNPDYRRRLAWSHNNLGEDLVDTRRFSEGEEQIRKALAIKEQLVRDYPSDPDYRTSLANSHINLGNMSHRRGNYQQAEPEERAALVILQELSKNLPSVPDYQSRQALVHNNLGAVLRDLGRQSEAKEQFERALAIYEHLARTFPDVAKHRWGVANSLALVAWVLADQGDYRQAAAELGRNDERAAGSGMARYNTACGWSLTLAAVLRDARISGHERDQLADQYAAQSLQWLKRAGDAGYFRDGANADWLRTDKALTPPLRSRPEFQTLLNELSRTNAK